MPSAYSGRVFSIANAIYKLNTSLAHEDPILLTKIVAEQLSHDIGGPWGYDGSTIAYRDGDEHFSVDWLKGGNVRFPFVKGELREYYPVMPINHLAPEPIVVPPDEVEKLSTPLNDDITQILRAQSTLMQ